MNINLSWDLFILVFFIVIVAYSLIIGRDNTLKVILGTYVAALAADATGNLFGNYVGDSAFWQEILRFVSLGSDEEAVVFVKVLVFVALVILFAVKGAFSVNTVDDRGAPVRLILSLVYAVMSAGLIISTILVFMSGAGFVGGAGGAGSSGGAALWDLYSQSNFVKSMVGNSYLWFSVPALAFLIQSLYARRGEE